MKETTQEVSMSDPWLRDAVSDHVLSVLDSMESQVMTLSGTGSDGASLKLLYELVRSVSSSILAVRAFDPMVPLLEGFEKIVLGLDSGKLDWRTRVGALLFQLVQTMRHGVKNLGLGTRVDQLLPKLFRDLTEVIAKLQSSTVEGPYFLSVQLEGGTFLIPCTQISKVLCRPPTTRSPGRGPLGWRSVFDGGALIPVLEQGKPVDSLDWVVVFQGFCLSVDSIGDVSKDAEVQAPILDARSLMQKAGAAA